MDRNYWHKRSPLGPRSGRIDRNIGALAQKSTPDHQPRLLWAKELINARKRSGFGNRLSRAKFDVTPIVIKKQATTGRNMETTGVVNCIAEKN